jgi:hypothetical protein
MAVGVRRERIDRGSHCCTIVGIVIPSSWHTPDKMINWATQPPSLKVLVHSSLFEDYLICRYFYVANSCADKGHCSPGRAKLRTDAWIMSCCKMLLGHICQSATYISPDFRPDRWYEPFRGWPDGSHKSVSDGLPDAAWWCHVTLESCYVMLAEHCPVSLLRQGCKVGWKKIWRFSIQPATARRVTKSWLHNVLKQGNSQQASRCSGEHATECG